MIPRMAARCTTPAAAMHHFGGMGAPFQRWLCTIICGQAALFERRTHSMAASSFYAAVEAVRAKKNGGFGTVKAADIYMGVSNELLDDGFFSLLSSIST